MTEDTVLDEVSHGSDGTRTFTFTSGYTVIARPLDRASRIAVFDTEGEIFVASRSVTPKRFEQRVRDALARHGGNYHALLESSSKAVVEVGEHILDNGGGAR